MQQSDLNQLWGTVVERVVIDHLEMSLLVDVFWTSGEFQQRRRMKLHNVSKFSFSAEQLYVSEIVELISVEITHNSNGIKVRGELSNYCFDVDCESISVDEGA